MSDSDSKPVLLTGFGPFPGVYTNTSSILLEKMASTSGNLITKELPVSYSRGPAALEEAVEQHNPKAIVMLGHAASAIGFRLETLGRAALTSATKDVDGQMWAGRSLGDLALLPTTVDVATATTALSSGGARVTLSDSAGGYVCNAVLYRGLTLAHPSRTNCTFIHVGPLHDHGGTNPLEPYVSGLQALIKTLV